MKYASQKKPVFKPFASVAIACIVLCTSVGRSQVEPVDSDASSPVITAASAPKTRLEAAATQKNVLVITGYTDIGETAAGDDGSAVRITAAEITNAATQAKEYGLIITVHQAHAVEREAKCYIDYDELDNLIAALGDMAKLDHTSTGLADIEARYRTKGELEVANINTGNGRMLAIRATQIITSNNQVVWATARHTLSQVGNFTQFMTNGKQTIDRLRASK